MKTGKKGCGCASPGAASAPTGLGNMTGDDPLRERVRRKLREIRGAGTMMGGLALFGASARPTNSVALASVRINAANGERLVL